MMTMKRGCPSLMLLSSIVATVILPLLVITLGSNMISGLLPSNSESRAADVHLEVTVLDEKFMRTPSCVHTFSQLQLTNTHDSETITILSMKAIPQTQETNSHTDPSLTLPEPQQISVSYFASMALTIEPKMTATIPITFFPQFPSNTNGRHDVQVSVEEKTEMVFNSSNIGDMSQRTQDSQLLSRASVADLTDLAGQNFSEVHHSKVEHIVLSNVIVSTSKGTMEVPISASALRQNAYKIPDSIVFHSDGFVTRGDSLYQEHISQWELHRRGGLNHFALDSSYDLYMTNPSPSEELRVTEIFQSRPDLIAVEYGHFGGWIVGGDSPARFNNCGPTLDEINFCIWPRSHELTGPIVISPGEKCVYIGSVRRTGTSVDSQPGDFSHSRPELFLGYLHIRTSIDFLTVSLVRAALEVPAQDTFTVVNSGQNLSSLRLTDGFYSQRIDIIDSDSDTVRMQNNKVTKNFTVPGMRKKVTKVGMHQKPDRIATKTHLFSTLAPDHFLEVSPSVVDFGLITAGTQNMHVGINITNYSELPLRLMRLTIAIDSAPENSVKEKELGEVVIAIGGDSKSTEREFALKIDVDIAKTSGENAVIEPNGGTLINTVKLVASSIEELLIPRDEFVFPWNYQGTVVIRFGNAHIEYSDWKKEVLRDPVAANNFVIEIPFTASIMHGYIEYESEDVFFPESWRMGVVLRESMGGKYHGVDHHDEVHKVSRSSNEDSSISREKADNFSTRILDRTLYFINRFPPAIRLLSIRIEKSLELDESVQSSEFCYSHFQIIGFEGSEGHSRQFSFSRAKNGEAWGGIALRYFYAQPTEDDVEGRGTYDGTSHCTLTLVTDLAGEFDIPLHIYSGRLDITIDDATSPIQCAKSSVTLSTLSDSDSARLYEPVIVDTRYNSVKYGMRCIEDWYAATLSGNALRAFLQRRLDSSQTKTRTVIADAKFADENAMNLLCTFFYLIAGIDQKVASSKIFVQPIILSLGAIGANQTETHSIFVKNHNPLPITIFAERGVMEGMEVRLGRTTGNILQQIQKAVPVDKLVNNEMDDISPLPSASAILTRLYHHSAVVNAYRDKYSGATIIDGVNQNNGTSVSIDGHSSEKYYNFRRAYPPFFNVSNFDEAESSLNWALNTGEWRPVLVAADGSMTHYSLDVLRETTTNRLCIVPPGGIARLDIAVRTPPRHALRGRDETPFISTGLVLKTNFGQTMPLLVTYNALLGKLELHGASSVALADTDVQDIGCKGDDDSVGKSCLKKPDETTIKLSVPATIRPLNHPPLLPDAFRTTVSTPHPFGVALFLKSTLSRDVTVKSAQCCNKWFQVVLTDPPVKHESVFRDVTETVDENDELCMGSDKPTSSTNSHSHQIRNTTTADTRLSMRRDSEPAPGIIIKTALALNSSVPGTLIGTLFSAISCPSNGHGSFASFYTCAREWLEHRNHIQPPGCGLSEEDILFDKLIQQGDNSSRARDGSGEALRLQTISKLKTVESYLKGRYNEVKQTAWNNHSNERGAIPETPIMNDNASFHPSGHSLLSMSTLAFKETEKLLHPLPNEYRGSILNDQAHSTDLDTWVQSAFVEPGVIEMFTGAASLWNALSDLGLNAITGHIRVQTDDPSSKAGSYPWSERSAQEKRPRKEKRRNSTSHSYLQNSTLQLSISMPTPLLHTTLDIPRIFHPRSGYSGKIDKSGNVLQFEATYVAHVATQYLPVHNPSGYPIKVRLMAQASSHIESYAHGESTTSTSSESQQVIFVQTHPSDRDPWWTGGSHYTADNEGSLTESLQNASINTADGEHVSLLDLRVSSVFLNKCFGRRCEEVVDFQNNQDKLHANKHSSSIGASTVIREVLRGRVFYSDDSLTNPAPSFNHSKPSAFALGLRSLKEIIIAPFSTEQVGPVYFRPPARGNFSCTLWLENSLTGLEAVSVRGRGGWEQIIFLDDDTMGGRGGHVENRYGKPTLVFPGFSEVFGRSVVSSVVVANIGDTTVKFENIYLSAAQVSSFTNRKQASDQLLRYHQRVASVRGKCVERGFRLLGCKDASSEELYNISTTGRFSGLFYFIRRVTEVALFAIPHHFCAFDGSKNVTPPDVLVKPNIWDGFFLYPNESKTLFVEHMPDCSFRTMYATLNIEYSSTNGSKPQDSFFFGKNKVDKVHGNHRRTWEQSFQTNKVELLLGYEMNARESLICRPSYASFPLFKEDKMGAFYSFNAHHVGSRFIGSLNFELAYGLLALAITIVICVHTINKFRTRLVSSEQFCNLLFDNHASQLTVQFEKSEYVPTCAENQSLCCADNWMSAYRCLFYVDPTSLDLVYLGKERIEQDVLARYKKQGLLPPHCLVSNGTFVKERYPAMASTGGAGSKSVAIVPKSDTFDSATLTKRARASQYPAVTLGDETFFRCLSLRSGSVVTEQLRRFKSFSEIMIVASELQLLPCRLDWREAARRGVIAPLIFEAKKTVGNRVYDLLISRDGTPLTTLGTSTLNSMEPTLNDFLPPTVPPAPIAVSMSTTSSPETTVDSCLSMEKKASFTVPSGSDFTNWPDVLSHHIECGDVDLKKRSQSITKTEKADNDCFRNSQTRYKSDSDVPENERSNSDESTSSMYATPQEIREGAITLKNFLFKTGNRVKREGLNQNGPKIFESLNDATRGRGRKRSKVAFSTRPKSPIAQKLTDTRTKMVEAMFSTEKESKFDGSGEKREARCVIVSTGRHDSRQKTRKGKSSRINIVDNESNSASSSTLDESSMSSLGPNTPTRKKNESDALVGSQTSSETTARVLRSSSEVNAEIRGNSIEPKELDLAIESFGYLGNTLSEGHLSKAKQEPLQSLDNSQEKQQHNNPISMNSKRHKTSKKDSVPFDKQLSTFDRCAISPLSPNYSCKSPTTLLPTSSPSASLVPYSRPLIPSIQKTSLERSSNINAAQLLLPSHVPFAETSSYTPTPHEAPISFGEESPVSRLGKTIRPPPGLPPPPGFTLESATPTDQSFFASPSPSPSKVMSLLSAMPSEGLQRPILEEDSEDEEDTNNNYISAMFRAQASSLHTSGSLLHRKNASLGFTPVATSPSDQHLFTKSSPSSSRIMCLLSAESTDKLQRLILEEDVDDYSNAYTPALSNTLSPPFCDSDSLLRPRNDDSLGAALEGMNFSGGNLLATILAEQKEIRKDSGEEKKGRDTNKMDQVSFPVGNTFESGAISGKLTDDTTSDTGKSLFGLGEGFNVMNFLNFLDDSMNPDAENGEHTDDEIGLNEKNSNSSYTTPLNCNSSAIAVSSDPWGNTEATARDVAYGAFVDSAPSAFGNSQSTESNVSITGYGNGIPLLTPDAILGVRREEFGHGEMDEKKDKRKKDNFFHRDSFYSDLLNG